ncbi:MAG: hypothetical protein COA42_10570 [Alteromonadaceae bacterium]|nr:MAG: hypothetical protein COA42_10570 [Alteromonadaceae bacterium]
MLTLGYVLKVSRPSLNHLSIRALSWKMLASVVRSKEDASMFTNKFVFVARKLKLMSASVCSFWRAPQSPYRSQSDGAISLSIYTKLRVLKSAGSTPLKALAKHYFMSLGRTIKINHCFIVVAIILLGVPK